MKVSQAAIISAAFVAISALSRADPAPIVHYAPAENLEHIDVELIDSAKHEIDFAACVLTDWPVMQALIRAADRGVKVRIYLDGTQLAEREPAKVFHDLAETPGAAQRKYRRGGKPRQRLRDSDRRFLHVSGRAAARCGSGGRRLQASRRSAKNPA